MDPRCDAGLFAVQFVTDTYDTAPPQAARLADFVKKGIVFFLFERAV